MKKIIGLLTFTLILIALSSCQKETPNIVFSKIFDATSMANNAIELYNASNNTIDLSQLEIRIFNNGSSTEGGDHQIKLEGKLEVGHYYVITGSNPTNMTLQEKADFKWRDSLPFNGNDVIELYYRSTLLDQFGLLGYDIDFSIDVTMIRLGTIESYRPQPTFDAFSYIAYLPNMFQYLKTQDHPIQTLEQLYEGPRLEARYLEMPYQDPNNPSLGFGGAVKTQVTGVADGDTAYFQALNGYPGGSLRYFYINTPEVDGSNVSAEAWGYVASLYNKNYLLNDSTNKEIHVQSIPGNALQEGYGRNLGLVWINGYLSQFLIVSEGLSESIGSQYAAYDYLLTYQNIPYLTFLRFAEQRAVLMGWGTKGYPSNIEGEKAPDWNFDTNRNTTQNPVWTPHLELPFN
jgi:micrococcal nuclease